MDQFTSIVALSGTHAAAVQGKRATDVVDMRVLTLLCARLCHELSGSIAAVNNGLELLADEDRLFADDAAELIGFSGQQAAARLQFYRFAYGFSDGGVTSAVQPRDLTECLFDGSRITCEYGEGGAVLPLPWQKLVCNLLLVGADALPRGGRLVLTTALLEIEAIGQAPYLSPETLGAMTLAAPVEVLTSRTVQAYFSGLLAASLGCRLVGSLEPGRVRLAVIPAD
jgi:histidine phosphotransferase ChpT